MGFREEVRMVMVVMMLMMQWLEVVFRLFMNHRKMGPVVELAVTMVRSVYFVMGFRHEVGKLGDLVSSDVEVVILLLHLMVSRGGRMVLGDKGMVMVVMMLMLKWLEVVFRLPIGHWEEGPIVELTVGMVRSVCFVLGLRHEVGKHSDLVGSEVEVVILLLLLLRVVREIQ